MILQVQVAKLIIDAVSLEGYTPETFPFDAPLFDSYEGGGLGFDSITSLEIVSQLAEAFPVNFDEIGVEDLQSVNAVVHYIERKRAELAAE